MKASMWRTKNRIIGIEDNMGNWQEEERLTTSAIESYFTDIFTTCCPSTSAMAKVTNTVRVKLDESTKRSLDLPFTKTEILEALAEMGATKAPSPDGFHAVFSQRSWEVVGKRVVELCLKILNDNASVEPLNRTFIVLIPKIKSAKKGRQISDNV
ncbi:hypothetical protein PanWU01x14_231340 [Parasponia andersonii]|uniref:Uncharacterized protein n=1 Tax=Parasponia andersonii TaxID=3476 RepID=A0A2P5BKE1_PARAD|nr:hypothetical protein PanWU01x14_231340 [Parasponia andersonii]